MTSEVNKTDLLCLMQREMVKEVKRLGRKASITKKHFKRQHIFFNIKCSWQCRSIFCKIGCICDFKENFSLSTSSKVETAQTVGTV